MTSTVSNVGITGGSITPIVNNKVGQDKGTQREAVTPLSEAALKALALQQTNVALARARMAADSNPEIAGRIEGAVDTLAAEAAAQYSK